jgi:hypothetical protein
MAAGNGITVGGILLGAARPVHILAPSSTVRRIVQHDGIGRRRLRQSGLMSANADRGLFARAIYLSLYKMHELALHGLPKLALDTLARLIVRRTEPHVKPH